MVIDKPAGLTSHDVVSRVKRILGAQKAGHTGTLDPMATGVLPVCIGEATKLARFLSLENKTYRATMLLGVRTDTQDIEGKVTQKSDILVAEENIRRVLAAMVGKIKQIPPAYSALKHKGKPLYKYARQGEFPEIAPRDVEIFNIHIKDISLPNVTFEVSCSKGTYIRTLCADAGEALGCGACLSGLRRLQSGFFTEDAAVSMEGDEGELKDRFLSEI
ncbi:MAG TPA: tRNA pseudouridine(55) synthase TruB, partial [Smithellaceae bacterium]|nr:tRNA pseudouridine(55) synthase TruB [Smithellaceae bacterium]